MTATDPFSTVRGARAAAFFEPYARLIQCLYPRAKGYAFYDATGALVWQKDAEVEAAMASQVRTLIKDSSDPEKNEQHGSHRLLQGSTPSYLFWLRDERNVPLGIAGITGKTAGMKAAPPTLAEIEKSLSPALQCLARELMALAKLPTADEEHTRQALEQSDWLAAQVLPLINSSVRREPLRAVLAALVDRTDAAVGALVIPERSLYIVVEPEGWNNEKAQQAVRHAHRRVLAHVQKSASALKLNRIGDGDDESAAYRLVAAPVMQEPGRAAGYAVLLKSSIGSDFGALEQRLLERATPLLLAAADRDYDDLTNLRNPASFERAARQMLPNDATAPSSLLMVDIGGLRDINARLDAQAGDRVIRRVAKLLRPPVLPAGTLCTRLGGGRYACLLLKRDLDDAEQVAQGLRTAAGKLAAARGPRTMEVRLRTGLATIKPSPHGLRDALIEASAVLADTPSAQAILSGRHQRPKARNRKTVPVFLREALRDDRLRIFAQPMHPLRDPRRPLRLELLARILDDQNRLVTPLEFLASGPDPDALAELDRSVMSATLEILSEHAPTLARTRVELALNISGRSLEISEFHDWICQQLRRGVVPADSWLFEISESIASRQQRDMERFARRVMSVGARVVLDDVGSAGTDAVRLNTHHASAIKMDGSLIRDLADDPRAQRLVEALAQWAGASRMETIAEQVETQVVRDQLARFGIDYVQGFVVCEPRPFRDVLEELDTAALAGPRASNG